MKVLVEKINCDIIKDDHCGVSFYDNFFDPKELDYMKFEKGIIAHIEPMTCDQYFENCKKIFRGKDPYRGLDMSAVSEYADMMRNGTNFNTPYLNWHNYFGPSQEGRHRMLAAKEVCGENATFPVLVCQEYTPVDQEIEEYAVKKFGEKNKDWGIRYINSCLDKYLDRNSDNLEEEAESQIEIVKGIDLGEDDVIDYGEGWAKITDVSLALDNLIEVTATLIDNNEDVYYYISDDEDVTKQKN